MRSVSLAAAAAMAAATLAGAQEQRPLVRPASGNIEDLRIRGRIQAQFGYSETRNDEGSDGFSTMELRRVRLGLRGQLAQNVRAQLEANLVPGSDLSMRSAFLEWREHPEAYVKLGLDKPLFGFEENTSSAEILTVERSLINNTLAPGTMNGLSVSGRRGALSYGAGIYADQANANRDGGSDYLLNASAQATLDDWVGDAKLRLRADWIRSDDRNGQFGRSFEEGMAVSFHYAIGSFDLRGEYMTAAMDGKDTRGFMIMPSVFLTDRLQAVARYESAESDRATGLRAPSRYARRTDLLAVREADEERDLPKIDPQRGNEYQALYLGANYYFANHAHKVMAGIEFAELDNTVHGTLDMTTVFTAWRMLF